MEDNHLLAIAVIGSVLGLLWLWLILEASVLPSTGDHMEDGAVVAVSGTLTSWKTTGKVGKGMLESEDEYYEIVYFKSEEEVVALESGIQLLVKGRLTIEKNKRVIIADRLIRSDFS